MCGPNCATKERLEEVRASFLDGSVFDIESTFMIGIQKAQAYTRAGLPHAEWEPFYKVHYRLYQQYLEAKEDDSLPDVRKLFVKDERIKNSPPGPRIEGWTDLDVIKFRFLEEWMRVWEESQKGRGRQSDTDIVLGWPQRPWNYWRPTNRPNGP